MHDYLCRLEQSVKRVTLHRHGHRTMAVIRASVVAVHLHGTLLLEAKPMSTESDSTVDSVDDSFATHARPDVDLSRD